MLVGRENAGKERKKKREKKGMEIIIKGNEMCFGFKSDTFIA